MSISTPEATAEPQAAPLFDRVHRWVRWLKVVLYTFVGLFVAVVAAEAVRLYHLAADVHPLLGWLVLLVAAAAALLIALPAWRFLSVPRALSPPRLPAPGELRPAHFRAELRFLDGYLSNCARNPAFADRVEEIETARRELAGFRGRVSGAGGELAELDEELGRWTAEKMGAVLAEIDAKADRIIYQESLGVGVATAVSPNGTLDAFVVLWRSVNLASKLAVLYYGRPGPLGTLAICRDVSVAMVAAVYLDKLRESISSVVAKTVGGVAGVVAGPAVDGVLNALVLIRVGYLAKERCRSFRSWDRRQQRSALVKALQATQNVAVGLTTEIFRQVGTGLGAAAEATARGIAQAAEAAAQSISQAAGSAWRSAADLGGRIGEFFSGRKENGGAAANEGETASTGSTAAAPEDER